MHALTVAMHWVAGRQAGATWKWSCFKHAPAAVQEAERVMETFEKHLHLPVTKIDDAERMLGLLKVPPPLLCTRPGRGLATESALSGILASDGTTCIPAEQRVRIYPTTYPIPRV